MVRRALFYGVFCLVVMYALSGFDIHGRELDDVFTEEDDGDANGVRWAVLIAGSNGFSNYKHQADVCHAYHIMKSGGGLKDENIIVFMYDDISNNVYNPRPGTIINHPMGRDVYAGVPKDYVGEDVNAHNFLAVLPGDKKSVKRGNGKVVDSGPNDHIFIFYSGHGAPGVLVMPVPELLHANDFIEVLKKNHAVASYKETLIYIEACKNGSILEGFLPEGLNIYVTTTSNAKEYSWRTYCLGADGNLPPPEYCTCLGDLYSVAWMEDSEKRDLRIVTVKQQYQFVKARVSNHYTYKHGSHVSHVMQYGNISISNKRLSVYMGTRSKNDNAALGDYEILFESFDAVNQRDADLFYLWQKYKRSKENSIEKLEAQQQLMDLIADRVHIDNLVNLIAKLLFGSVRGPVVVNAFRPSGQPVVDDWVCHETMVRVFQENCGSFSTYGLRHSLFLANACNEGVTAEVMASVTAKACSRFPSSY